MAALAKFQANEGSDPGSLEIPLLNATRGRDGPGVQLDYRLHVEFEDRACYQGATGGRDGQFVAGHFVARRFVAARS